MTNKNTSTSKKNDKSEKALAANTSKSTVKSDKKATTIDNATVSKSDIFTVEARDEAKSATIAAKELNEARKAAKKNNVDNSLVSATIRVNNKITKTAIIESALSIAASSISSCSITQIVAYIEKELNVKKFHYKRETNNASRVRCHVRDSLTESCTLDENDIIFFSATFVKLCKENKEYKTRLNTLIDQIKALDSKEV